MKKLMLACATVTITATDPAGNQATAGLTVVRGTGTLKATLTGHTNMVYCVAFELFFDIFFDIFSIFRFFNDKFVCSDVIATKRWNECSSKCDKANTEKTATNY